MTALHIPFFWFTIRIELVPAARRAVRRRTPRPGSLDGLSAHLLKDIGVYRD